MKNPILIKTAMTCIIVTFLLFILIVAKELLVPIIIAALLAMVLLPLSKLLERYMPKIAAIFICLTTIISIISGIIFLFYYYMMLLMEKIPLFKIRATEKLERIRSLIEAKTGISSVQQMDYINSAYDKWVDEGGFYIQDILIGITEVFAVFALIIIYIFFFLLYRQKIKNFILKLFPETSHTRVSIIINHTQDMSQNYLTGLLIELTVLGTLNAIGLSILGIQQAIFFGFLAGLLNIIPYVGVLIGSLFPIFMAFIFKDSFASVLAVIGVMTFNQFIDNNILTPKIIGSHIQINALAAIIVIILGGMVWGIPGMILFIPLLGIFKIVCDFVVFLHPVSYLLGEDIEDGKINYWTKIKGVLRKPTNA